MSKSDDESAPNNILSAPIQPLQPVSSTSSTTTQTMATGTTLPTGGSVKIKSTVLECRKLTDTENFTSFKQWQTSLLYTIRDDDRFVKFVEGQT